MNNDNIQAEFNKKMLGDLWHEYKTAYGYGNDVIAPEEKQVSEFDMSWFLKALKLGIVQPKTKIVRSSDKCRYSTLRNKGSVAYFGHKKKDHNPRKLYVSLEPIIIVGAIARLHCDYNWHTTQLALESERWAFDAVAYEGQDRGNEYLLCEVKKTKVEIDKLCELMQAYLQSGRVDDAELMGKEKNAFRKVIALRKSPAKVLWAVGPDKYEKIFKIDRSEGKIKLNEANENALKAP